MGQPCPGSTAPLRSRASDKLDPDLGSVKSALLKENTQVIGKPRQKGKATMKGAPSDCFMRLSHHSARPRGARQAEGLQLAQVRSHPLCSITKGRAKNHPSSVNCWMQLQT